MKEVKSMYLDTHHEFSEAAVFTIYWLNWAPYLGVSLHPSNAKLSCFIPSISPKLQINALS